MADTPTVQVVAEMRGAVPLDEVGFAVNKVGSLLRLASEPVLSARVKLTAYPSVRGRAVAQVNVNLNGRPLRAEASGPTMRVAVQHAGDRLRIRLERAARNREAIPGRQARPRPGQWRHQYLPAPRLPRHPRPAGERVVVRRKSYALARETPEEAAAEAELMDYDFHLFTERSTGQDGVIYRTADGHRLQLAYPRSQRPGLVDPSITISEVPAPRLAPSEAAVRLEAACQPFLFFLNAQTGRGNVLYHRYDGHYGLIAPPG
jgi:ribosome-associated translation inhibitor RaiA